MDFELSEEHRILRDTVRAFAESEIRPVARELDDREEFSVGCFRHQVLVKRA